MAPAQSASATTPTANHITRFILILLLGRDCSGWLLRAAVTRAPSQRGIVWHKAHRARRGRVTVVGYCERGASLNRRVAGDRHQAAHHDVARHLLSADLQLSPGKAVFGCRQVRSS